MPISVEKSIPCEDRAMNELDMQRLKRIRAELNEISSELVPLDSIECPDCGCKFQYITQAGSLHCGACHTEFDAKVNLE